MRPKKLILYVDSDDASMSVRSFMLTTRGYKVMAAATVDEALDALRMLQIDLVLVAVEEARHKAALELAGLDGFALVQRIQDHWPHMPTILVSTTIRVGARAHQAWAFLGQSHSQVELLERVRIASQRKRGPRKQAQIMPAEVATV